MKLRRPVRIGCSPVVVDEETEPAAEAIANRQPSAVVFDICTRPYNDNTGNAGPHRAVNWAWTNASSASSNPCSDPCSGSGANASSSCSTWAALSVLAMVHPGGRPFRPLRAFAPIQAGRRDVSYARPGSSSWDDGREGRWDQLRRPWSRAPE